MDQDTSIEHITYAFPFGLALRNIEMPLYGNIKELRVFISPLTYFSNRMEVRSVELIYPILELKSQQMPPAITPSIENNKISQRSDGPSNTIFINKINIQDGQITFRKNKVQRIQGHIDHIALPLTEEQIDFTLRGKILTNSLWAIMQTHGWINWNKKDMHAKLTLLQEDTKNEVHADLEAKNNDLAINGEMKITGALNKSFTNTAIVQSILQNSVDGDEATVQTNFSFQTQLDNPKIEKIKFTGNLVSNP